MYSLCNISKYQTLKCISSAQFHFNSQTISALNATYFRYKLTRIKFFTVPKSNNPFAWHGIQREIYGAQLRQDPASCSIPRYELREPVSLRHTNSFYCPQVKLRITADKILTSVVHKQHLKCRALKAETKIVLQYRYSSVFRGNRNKTCTLHLPSFTILFCTFQLVRTASFVYHISLSPIRFSISWGCNVNSFQLYKGETTAAWWQHIILFVYYVYLFN